MDLHKLKEHFPPDKISWRVGATTKDKSKGLALAYIDARDVMERLDSVCGPENWQVKYSHAEKIVICELSIYVDGIGWVTKANGAGETDVEGEKGATSDAFKRSAVLWGIGRYLYDVESIWVELDEYKAIKNKKDPKLAKSLGGKTTIETKIKPVLPSERMDIKTAVDSLLNAKDIDVLRAAFGSAYKQFPDVDQRELLKINYEAQKSRFEQPEGKK